MSLKTAVLALATTLSITTHSAFADNNASSSSDWSGQYVGLALGVAHERSIAHVGPQTTTYFSNVDKNQLKPLASKDLDKILLNGSLMWGINRQSGNIVYGLEADISKSDFDEQHSYKNVTFKSAPGQNFNMTTTVSSDWAASLRPRLGYAHDETLYFVSAGPTMTKFNYDFTYSDRPVNNQSASLSSSKIAFGAMAGMGAEHKFLDGWSVRAEYLYSYYANIIDEKSSLTGTYSTDGFDHEIDHETHNLRIGLIRRF